MNIISILGFLSILILVFNLFNSLFTKRNRFDKEIKNFSKIQVGKPEIGYSSEHQWSTTANGDCTIRRINGETLTIVYKGGDYGYRCISGVHFNSEAEMGIYIQDHVEESIREKVRTDNYTDFFLNVCRIDDQDTERIPDWAWTKGYRGKLLRKQLQIYMPIIRYFMLHGFKTLLGKDCID